MSQSEFDLVKFESMTNNRKGTRRWYASGDESGKGAGHDSRHQRKRNHERRMSRRLKNAG